MGQRPEDQPALSFIDHDPVFVVRRHGRDFAPIMALPPLARLLHMPNVCKAHAVRVR